VFLFEGRAVSIACRFAPKSSASLAGYGTPIGFADCLTAGEDGNVMAESLWSVVE